jgi:hypothetical protein
VLGSLRGRWVVIGAVGLAAVVAVAIGWFGVHTLFIDDVVDEAGPQFDSGAAAVDATDTDITDGETSDGEPVDSADPGEGAGDAGAAPEVMTLATGAFEGVGRYSGAGTATVLGDGTDQRFVRFEEDFSTDNGPDLFVFLGTGSGAYGDPAEYIELGTLRGNIGSQNYEIPPVHPDTGEPIDLDRFDHVAVWCKRFDATFAVAMLT